MGAARSGRRGVPKDNDAFAGLGAIFGTEFDTEDADEAPCEGSLGAVDIGLVRTALRVYERGGIADLVTGWVEEDRARREVTRRGPGPWVPPAMIVVLLMLLGLRRQPLLFTSMRDMVCQDFHAEVWELLGIESFESLGITEDNAYDRLYNSYRNLRDLMNPEPGSLRRVLTKAEVSAMIAARDRDECAARRDRAHVFANAILHGTWMLLPRDVRRSWKGNVVVDATFVAAPAARGTSKRSDFASSDPEAGWYRREGDHAGDPDTATNTTRAKTRYQRTKSALGWGRELTTLVPYGNKPGKNACEVPHIVLATSFDRPGVDVSGNALRVIDGHLAHGRPVGTFVSDRAYLPNTRPVDLALPLRARGYDLVMDYMGKEQMLGVQAAHEGALLIDGTWYCPSMPQLLQTATFDHQLRPEGDPLRLTDEEYRQRIAQRDRYRLRNKEQPDGDGYVRKMCPAAGPSATVACPLQTQHPKAAARPGLTPILTVNLLNPAPKVCTNQSTLTFPPEVGAKYEQAHPYKSPTWQAHFTHGRQAVESVNGSIKDGKFLAIDDPENRPRRGWIAQFLAVTVMVAATNVRKIVAWFKERTKETDPAPTAPRRRARRRDLTDGYRSAPKNDPPESLAS